MNKSTLKRYSGVALIGSGLCTIAFWLLVIPFESFAGPEVPLQPLFLPGQMLHLLGAVLSVFGLTGLYLHIRDESGWLGLIAYVVAVLGALGVFGDAIIGGVIFPVLARHAPELTSPSGPMFTGRVLAVYIAFFATNMIGIILMGVSVYRSGKFPTVAAGLFVLGGVLANLPPNPALHLLLVAGGVIWGIAAAWLGIDLRHQAV